MMSHQLPILIPLLLLIGAMVVPLAGRNKPAIAHRLTVAVCAGCFALAVALAATVLQSGPIRYALGGWPPPIGIEFVVDLLSVFFLLIITGLSLLVIAGSAPAVARDIPGRTAPFFAITLTLLLGLSGIVITGDLFNLYVFLEIASISAYALVSSGDERSGVAAFRYLVLGTLGASFYLLGLGFLYTVTGTLNMADMMTRLDPAAAPVQIAAVMITVGIGLKMAIFPMHQWLPDAYTHASSTATALIAPIMTKVSAYVLIRIFFFVFGTSMVSGDLPIAQTIMWLSVAGIVVGSIMAIAQSDLKRMLAYSSVAQVAYIGVGIGLATPVALAGALLHVLNHAAMKSCLFLVIGAVEPQTGSRNLSALNGIGRKMPWTFAAFSAAAIAMVGLPPTGGFFSKWYLVLGGMAAREWWVVTFLLVSSLLTAIYFFRLLEQIYARPTPDSSSIEDVPLALRFPILILGLAVVFFGLSNTRILDLFLRGALPPGMVIPG